MENVTYIDHPLVQHKISMLRKKTTGTNEFRTLVEEIATLMGYEALRDSLWRTLRSRLQSRHV